MQTEESHRDRNLPAPSVTGSPAHVWIANQPEGHFVQFYEEDNTLLDALEGYLGSGLLNGDNCVVIATADHREALSARLARRGISVRDYEAQGGYLALDAAQALAGFMRDGAPDPNLFVATIGNVVGSLLSNGCRLRAYGEMVALLWSEGNHDGAIALESLWNDLLQTHDFPLFCAYSMEGCDGTALQDAMTAVCHAHTYVVPGESYVKLETEADRMREIALLQQRARSLEMEIDRREQTERALRESEARMRNIFEQSTAGIAQVDMSGRFILVNERFCEITGYPAEELQQTTCLNITHPDDVACNTDTLQEAVRDGKPFVIEKRYVRPDGSIVWVNNSVSALHTGDGEARYMIAVTIDITERKRAEQELLQRKEEVELLNGRLQRAMVETHHRVKNNLQVIAAMVDMQTVERAAQQTVPLEEMERLGSHIRTLAAVHDVLTGSLREEERHQTLSAGRLIERLIPLMEQVVCGRTLVTHVKDVSLTGKQAAALSLVIHELVTNSVKHGSEPIELQVEAEGESGRLIVRDHGAGFSQDFNCRENSGTGLELADALITVDLRGKLSYTNDPEGGAVVTVTFPLNTATEFISA